MNRLARWLVGAIAALGIVLLGLSLLPASQPPGTQRITHTRFAKSDAPVPPVDNDAAWVRRDLPDNWLRTNPGLDGFGWYRATFELDAPPLDPWGAYMPSVSTSYQLLVNGVDVGTSGGMAGNYQRVVGQPQFDSIPAQVLQAGENELLLRLRVAPNLRGGLGPITVGPRPVVEALYERDHFVRVILSRSMNIALIFAGLLVLLLWLRRPGESVHGYFAALAIVWSLRNFHYTVSAGAIPSWLWEAFILGSLGVVVLLLWLFMLRFTGRSHPRAEPVVTAVCLAAPILFAAIDPHDLRYLRIPWYLACAALGIWTIVVLADFLRTPRGQARTGAWLILVALVLTLLLGLADLAVSAQLLPFGPAARMAFGAPILLCTLVYAIAENYFSTFDEVRLLNAELEQRVRDRTAELERTHERMRMLERDAAIAGERERLMRDMHDGVGSQLMTTLDAVEHGRLDAADVGRLLRECIDDLRLVIDSLEPSEHSLGLALANLRYRLEPRLQAAGLRLRWDVDDAPLPSPPGTVLQVMRIVQEALANALRHAEARTLVLRLRAAGDALVLDVADDGKGLPAGVALESGGTGVRGARRGLNNMRLRAQQLGGELTVRSDDTGTCVSLRAPIARLRKTHDAGSAAGLAARSVPAAPPCGQRIPPT